ncbi:cysteinyl-tRNA synthetase [Diatrype stigma]|uniref:Cysteinyl-tRNA synthetase n=1 Tax=Diatrype stigma TaxID=117547 RepID=A0AAN9YLK1_9PEZI
MITTIKEALEPSSPAAYTARSMRIVFLLGRWNEGVEISPDMRTYAASWESTVNKFFTNTKSRLAEAGVSVNAIQDSVQKLSVGDEQTPDGLLADLEQAQKEFKAALTNSFDTPQAMRVILDIIRKANIHLADQQSAQDLRALEAIARWITEMVGILGLDSNAEPPYKGLGWSNASAGAVGDPKTAVESYKKVYDTVVSDIKSLELPASDSITSLLSQTPDAEFDSLVSTGTPDLETLASPYVRAISKLRDELRRIAPTTSEEARKTIHNLSDRIRNEDLLDLCVYLDDRPGGLPSLIKFVSASEMTSIKEKRANETEEAIKSAKLKEEKKREQEKKAREALEKGKTRPEDLHKGDERYSDWDADGMPTKMKDGSDVPKSQLKKLKKEWENQKKLHEKYLSWVATEAEAASKA